MPYDPMGSTVKFSRACKHLNAIVRAVRKWSAKTTYETISEPDPEASGLVHCQRYVAKISGPPVPELAAVLGDCLHNFRGVLDHMVWFASMAYTNNRPINPRYISFPIWDDGDTYEARGLDNVAPEVRAFIQTLQPYHAGDNARSQPLWALHALNNIDKHRELHTVHHVAVLSEVTVSALPFGAWIESGDTSHVENGTVIARVFTPPSIVQSNVAVNLQVAHGIAIEETETTPYLRLLDTLYDIRDAVRGAAGGIVTAMVTEVPIR
jgi:hypothetical protein